MRSFVCCFKWCTFPFDELALWVKLAASQPASAEEMSRQLELPYVYSDASIHP